MTTPFKTFSDGDVLAASDMNTIASTIPSTYKHTTTVNVASTTAETDLNSVTITGGDLTSTGSIRLKFVGVKTGNNNTAILKVYISSTAIFTKTSIATLWPSKAQALDIFIVNTATNAQRCVTTLQSGFTTAFPENDAQYATATIDTTANFTVKVTVQLASASDSYNGYFLIADEIVT